MVAPAACCPSALPPLSRTSDIDPPDEPHADRQTHAINHLPRMMNIRPPPVEECKLRGRLIGQLSRGVGASDRSTDPKAANQICHFPAEVNPAKQRQDLPASGYWMCAKQRLRATMCSLLSSPAPSRR